MIYYDMLKYWAAMVGGHSYWHQAQGIGRQFRPRELHGYFNDLTAKAAWPGESDRQGIPLSTLEGKKTYWPTTVLQKGLAHWDLWLQGGCNSDEHLQNFREAARWAIESQDSIGGWRHPIPLHPRALSTYSCMSQGQGVSLLVRASRETGNEEYLVAARRAIQAMLMPTVAGGTAVYEGDKLTLEERPAAVCNTVLNGWIFAIFGLYDYQLVKQDPEVSESLMGAVRGLIASLPQFDCGFWSLYDLSGAIASPFYQRLHIAQLDAMSLAFSDDRGHLSPWRDRFSRQLASRLNVFHSVAIKATQRLLRPPIVIQKAGT
jgi:hypothetical protein